MDSQEILRSLRNQLGKDPDPEIWALLEEDGYVQEAADAAQGGPGDFDSTLDGLTQRYRRLEKLRLPQGSKPEGALQRESAGKDESLDLLSEIMALNAAQSPFVQAFRHHALSDRLLTSREADEWLQKHAQYSETHALAHVPRDSLWGWDGLGRSSLEESEWAVYEHVSYILGRSPDWPKATQVAGDPTESDRILDFLYCVCDVLVSRYGWSRGPYDSIARFLLTGETPPLSGVHLGRIRNSSFPEAAVYVIHALPSTSPRELMDLYSSFRRKTLGGEKRHRRLKSEKAALALFIAQKNDGRTWEEAMEAWNFEAGKPTYSEVRAFARDAREAYQKTTGADLRWENSPSSQRRRSVRELYEDYGSLAELALFLGLPADDVIRQLHAKEETR